MKLELVQPESVIEPRHWMRHDQAFAMMLRPGSTAILVSASIIAGVRLAREPIKNSPKVNATIEDSLQLARMIWAKIAPDR